MKVKDYTVWIDGMTFDVEAPNKRIAKWCGVSVYNALYLPYRTVKDVERVERIKVKEATK
jgi:hypothetical protein